MQALIDDITAGRIDQYLDDLSTAIRERTKTLGAAKLQSVEPGDKVKLKDSIYPTYLAGSTGTVEKIEDGQYHIRLEQLGRRAPRNGRFRIGTVCRARLSHLGAVLS